jgi:hypothetical protein
VAENKAAYAPTFTLVNDGTNSNYAFTFKKPIYRPSAQYQVQKSTDLMSWTAAGDSLVGEPGNRNASRECLDRGRRQAILSLEDHGLTVIRGGPGANIFKREPGRR